LREMSESAEDWMDQARLTLIAAGDLLAGGLSEEAVSSSFLAMVYAARATLEGVESEIPGWEEVVGLFQREALPGLGLSKENQRALFIVADLYRRVSFTREVEADPVTAAACLEDARAFIAEIEGAIDSRG